MKSLSTKEIAKCGLAAALVFIFTYTFKIPSPNGYTHLGDAFILLSVLVLGRQKGAFAGGIGAALADFVGGYAIWVLPTFIIKFLMAYVMGLFAEKILASSSWGYITGAVIGGILQIILYTVVKLPIFVLSYALIRLPGLTVQTICGIIIAVILAGVLDKANVLKMVKEM